MLTRSWHLARLTGATVLAGDLAREHGVWHSNWAAGLLLILLALAAVIGVAILASLVS